MPNPVVAVLFDLDNTLSDRDLAFLARARWFAADHLLREPLDHLAAVGFAVECMERSKWGIVERVAARTPG